MQRYFVDKQEQSQFILENDDRHHIVKVMRMNPGDEIICVNPDGRSAICKIAEITDEAVVADIVKWNDETVELPVRVTIACGLPKGDKLEWIIQKGTEMGAYSFIPFAAKRSVVKLDEKKSGKKTERWQKIAKEAAEQSHRNQVPGVSAPIDFHTLLKESKNYDFKVVAYEEESRSGETANFVQTLNQLQTGDSLFIVFGPEGGLSEKEARLLEDHDFKLCGLGPRILRAETAPLYALAAISYQLELMR
ncbi:16S rRNA (uracil(1498)-N(3))-methyltransferase [Neobacillus notoginsengisoli]|uniref:Ribosomal RNA small subunit methyltransferase E n=1 Tax=Neobacillus notoginsengisoli TaxID=1578198 RepID=A0A417YUQ1_9BACI|nr:16S rRNA (uracil(1498)-N(3))-methyltransferase [Neobacillus notoginsengisoli]RHW41010.1 16S rRNA (uracil(1498)-N(3))-methyltransferase [Neobacillus notoginsengisoli]